MTGESEYIWLLSFFKPAELTFDKHLKTSYHKLNSRFINY